MDLLTPEYYPAYVKSIGLAKFLDENNPEGYYALKKFLNTSKEKLNHWLYQHLKSEDSPLCKKTIDASNLMKEFGPAMFPQYNSDYNLKNLRRAMEATDVTPTFLVFYKAATVDMLRAMDKAVSELETMDSSR